MVLIQKRVYMPICACVLASRYPDIFNMAESGGEPYSFGIILRARRYEFNLNSPSLDSLNNHGRNILRRSRP